jgi:integrase
MAIRERTWEWNGKAKSAWVYEWKDLKGKKRLKTFKTKKAAQDFEATTRIDIKNGTHIADGDSITVAQAGELWLATCEDDGLKRSSIGRNRTHVNLHINPMIGATRLNKVTVAAVRAFADRLRDAGRSKELTKMVLVSLGSILADAHERGLATSNAVRDMKRRRGKRKGKAVDEGRAPLAIGVDIPHPDDIRAMLAKASGKRRVLLALLAFTGLRGSELRALRWLDVDFEASTISIRQAADLWGDISPCGKSDAAWRTIPMLPLTANALKEWKLACPRRDTGKKDANSEPIKELHLVYPNEKGRVQLHQHIDRRDWQGLQIEAGVSVPLIGEDGEPVGALGPRGQPVLDDGGKPVPVMVAKYTGLHALRHFFCSWCAARKEDGGLGLPLKTVQVRMGHGDLSMTANRYGHLWPAADDAGELAAAEGVFLAAGERALMGA